MHTEPNRTPGASDSGTAEVCVSRGGSLDGWIAHCWDEAIDPDALGDLESLRVHTRNSSYDLAAIPGSRGQMLVRGGRYFPDWTPVSFLGSSLGGALLKRHALHLGLRMEFCCGGRRIVTSPVHSIGRNAVVRPAAAS